MPFWFPLCYHQPTYLVCGRALRRGIHVTCAVQCMLGFSSWGTFGWWLYRTRQWSIKECWYCRHKWNKHTGATEICTLPTLPETEVAPPYVLWNSAHRVTQQWLTLKVELSGRMTSSTNSIGLFLAWWPLVSRGSNSGTLSQGGGGRISVKPSILNFNLKGGKCQLRKRVDVSIFSEEESVIGGGSWILYTGETSV